MKLAATAWIPGGTPAVGRSPQSAAKAGTAGTRSRADTFCDRKCHWPGPGTRRPCLREAVAAGRAGAARNWQPSASRCCASSGACGPLRQGCGGRPSRAHPTGNNYRLNYRAYRLTILSGRDQTGADPRPNRRKGRDQTGATARPNRRRTATKPAQVGEATLWKTFRGRSATKPAQTADRNRKTPGAEKGATKPAQTVPASRVSRSGAPSSFRPMAVPDRARPGALPPRRATGPARPG